MRTSFLSRSVIAVASLAIGSVALAATPATAATASGITREMVLTITTEARAADGEHTSSLERKVSRLAARACNVEIDGWTSLDNWDVKPVETGNVDGLLVSVELHEVPDNLEEATHRQCTFAVLTTTDPAFALSGNGSVSVETRTYDEATDTDVPGAAAATSALSGDVFVTGPALFNSDISSLVAASFSASGNAKRPFNVTTQQKVATPKSKAAKKSAKKAYAKKLKSAKKAYAKAVKKAGSSKSKKASAKKAYAAKRATAKAAYSKAVATFKVVSKTTQQAENRPFNVSANLPANNPI